MTDFPDRNLDVLRERTASMRPGRHSLTDIGVVEYMFPDEPAEDMVVYYLDNTTGQPSHTFYRCPEGWIDVDPATLDEKERPDVYSDASSWGRLISDAIGQQLRFAVGPKPTEEASVKPYRGQEDDGETD